MKDSVAVASPSTVLEAPESAEQREYARTPRPTRRTRGKVASKVKAKRVWPVLATLALSLTLIAMHPLGLARVVDHSMDPTLQDGSVAVVRAGWEGGIHRGDVVVFGDPGGWGEMSARIDGGRPPSSFVRRVVGVAGDTVQCCDAYGRTELGGLPLDEPYARAGGAQPQYTVVVPPGQLWVVGDNRPDSLDSRSMRTTPRGGFVPISAVTGVVLPRP